MNVPAPAAPHGYSGRPLYQKLGLLPGMRCLPLHAPDHYLSLLDGAARITLVAAPGPAECVHLFCANRADLVEEIAEAIAFVAPKGMLWLSWPKKSSALFRDLTEDILREVILPTGWVDTKVCAVDQDWSGLIFLRRKA